MIRTLLIIAGAALVLAVATLAGAAAIGGRDMARHGWNWTFRDGDGDTVSIVRDDGPPPADVTRTLAWTGGEALAIDLSADVDYVQGETAGVTVTGPAHAVGRVRLDGGRLTMAETDDRDQRIVFGRRAHGGGVWFHGGDLRIVVTAPAVKRFDMMGSSTLSIRGYDQPTLDIESSGSGDIVASGRAAALTVSMNGSGDVDLEQVVATDAEVDISGSGDARIAPTRAATVAISGSGDVDLVTRPATLRQSVSGSGDVNQE